MSQARTAAVDEMEGINGPKVHPLPPGLWAALGSPPLEGGGERTYPGVTNGHAAKEGLPWEALGAKGKRRLLTQLSSGAKEWSKKGKERGSG